MKLSKKLIAALVTMALVVAQVSVLPFAETAAANPYATGYDDGAYYFWRVPNTTKDGGALPKNSAGKTYANAAALGVSELSSLVGRDPETLEYKKTGGVFIEVEEDGERFVELDYNDDGGDCTSFTLSSAVYYNGQKLYPNKGIPAGIDAADLEGWAIRFKTTGEGKSGWELRVADEKCVLYGYMRNLDEYTFIDANTREVSTITYGTPDGEGGVYYTEGEMDGWIIVPFTAYGSYDAEKVAKAYLENWQSIGVHGHGASCASSHSGGWSNWDGRKLYIGDSMFLTNIRQFINVHTAPTAPELEKKYSDSITIVPTKGVDYSIAKLSAPETILETNDHGVFTGLEQNTEYVVSAAWKDKHNNYVSKRTYLTDLENPPMDAPEIIEGSLTDISVAIKVIPGLEYSLVGENKWNETGIFEGFDPNKEYQIIGRNKKTLEETAPVAFTTLKLENIYDRGDGSSTIFEVPRDTTTYKPSYINGNFQRNASGGLNIVNIEGERFVEAKQAVGEKANISLTGEKAWNGMTTGVPREIWLENFWGMAFRIKIDEGPEDLYFYLRYSFGGSGADYANGRTYYLIDSTTGTWSKHVKNGQWKLQGFDGWIVLPFKEFFKNPTYDYKYFQNKYDNISYYLNGNSSQTGTVSWATAGVTFYMGDGVFIEDIEKFMTNHAPNTTTPIIPPARNNMTDKSIPAIMANDCSGSLVGEGIVSKNKARPNTVTITKANEESEALHITPGFGVSDVMVTNDALNYNIVPKDVSDRISESLGVAFYLEVPETLKNRVHFGVQIKDSGTEFHNFGSLYSYITISDGVVTEKYGSLEFKPGFKGYVMLPFLHFDYESTLSTNVDGMINSPDNIEYVGFTFDAETYPEVADSYIIVDDIMLYQSQEEFTSAIVEIQGGTDSTIVYDEKTFQIDLNPRFPRVMANDCTGIEEEDGIYAIDGLYLTLVDIVGTNDSYVDVTIGKGLSSVMFENHATEMELTETDYENLLASTGLSFDISVPEDAPMIVGMDLEISEAESEYFLYDANKYYYTVEDGKVYKVYGYLEFEPGFNGTVIVPFENMYFDQDYSTFYDGQLTFFDSIDYFGFYFNTDYYASIEDTTVSIDNISFYKEKYSYIASVWAKQTGKGTINPKAREAAYEIQVINESPETGDSAPVVAVAGILALSAVAVALTRKKKED